MRSAQEAFGAWSRRAITDRGAVLHAGAEALLEHVDELAPGLVAEQGKTLREAKLELRKAADTLEHYAGLAKQVRGIAVHGLDAGVEGRVLRRPLGVVAAIVPWNFPTTLLSNKLGPALLCGNTVVAKPADTTPFTTLRLAEILTEAGLPPGVLNVVPGTGPVAGEALRQPPARAQGGLHRLDAHRAARGRAGRAGRQARDARARRLGPDDHLRRRRPREGGERGEHGALLQLRPGVPGHQARVRLRRRGRRGRRPRSRPKAGRLRVGIGTDEGVHIGPLHSERQRALLEDQLARTLARRRRGRRRRRAPGRPASSPAAGSTSPPSWSIRRTTRRWRPRRSSARCCPIWRVRDLDEALALANASPFGLGSSVWTRDLDRAERAAAELECGYTWVNSPTKVYDELPFGGVKASGYGKEHGSEALDHYSDLKAVVVKRGGGMSVSTVVPSATTRASWSSATSRPAAATRPPTWPPTRR